MIKRPAKNLSSQAGKKAKTSPQKISKLFSKILPDDFQSKTALINQYQHFFNSLESDAVFQMVRVMSVDANILTISLPSAGLVNYMRLHADQISKEIEHQFGQMMALKIISTPAGAQNEMPPSRLKPAEHFSAEVCDKIKVSAKNIDDEELRQSLLRLADAIKKKEN